MAKLTDYQIRALQAAAQGSGAWEALCEFYRARNRAKGHYHNPHGSHERSASVALDALCRRGLLARNLHFGVAITSAGRAELAAEGKLP